MNFMRGKYCLVILFTGTYPIQLAQFVYGEKPMQQHTFGNTHEVSRQLRMLIEVLATFLRSIRITLCR